MASEKLLFWKNIDNIYWKSDTQNVFFTFHHHLDVISTTLASLLFYSQLQEKKKKVVRPCKSKGATVVFQTNLQYLCSSNLGDVVLMHILEMLMDTDSSFRTLFIFIPPQVNSHKQAYQAVLYFCWCNIARTGKQIQFASYLQF